MSSLPLPTDAPEAPPVTGLVAGKYELVSLIGRGGMGSVWEGRHVKLGIRVAIKFIDAELAASDEARTRFENEARAAAAIQSKHAIQIFDHGLMDDKRPYMVMELLSGEPLDKVLDRNGRMSLGQTARLMQQVCRALQRAHESGIIHRDLKPENIFLVRNTDDDEEIAKVLDFGIAKMKATPGQGMDSGTRTGTLLGTPFYMSPEQARGLRSVDHRSDLWALGVIGYRCVVGCLPFDGESIGDLLVNICTGPIPVPSVAAHGLPVSFDQWFAKACDRTPANRFQSAQELSEGLLMVAGISIRRGPSSSLDGGDGRLSQLGGGSSGRFSTPHATGASGRAPETVMAGTADALIPGSRKPSSSARALVIAGIGALAVGGGVGGFVISKLRSQPATPVLATPDDSHGSRPLTGKTPANPPVEPPPVTQKADPPPAQPATDEKPAASTHGSKDPSSTAQHGTMAHPAASHPVEAPIPTVYIKVPPRASATATAKPPANTPAKPPPEVGPGY